MITADFTADCPATPSCIFYGCYKLKWYKIATCKLIKDQNFTQQT